MIKLNKPLDCKSREIGEITRQKNVRANPTLLKFGLKVRRLAAHYDAHNGNPLVIRCYKLSAAEKTEISYLYGHPPAKLAYIHTLRQSLAGDTCPMCGGQNPATLDHYLPQGKFPEHALLPYNLVPACSCNSKRGEAIVDSVTGVRLLHPYYDDCLAVRLYHVGFDPALAVPEYVITPELDAADPNYGNLLFHIEKILKRTNFLEYFGKRWLKLKAAPSDMLPGERHNRTNIAQFKRFLTEFAEARERTEGLNAWEAVFFRSIARDNVADWLFANT